MPANSKWDLIQRLKS